MNFSTCPFSHLVINQFLRLFCNIFFIAGISTPRQILGSWLCEDEFEPHEFFFSDIKKRTCLFSFKATSSSWSPGFRAVHMVLWDRYGTAFWSFPMYPAFSVTSNGGFIEKGHLIWKDFIHYIKLYLKLLVKSTNSTIKSILGLAFSLSSGNGRLVATRLLIIRKSISEDKKVYKYK